MADESTLKERREQYHQKTEPKTGEPPLPSGTHPGPDRLSEMGPLLGIGKFLLPRREPTEFTDVEEPDPLEGSVLDELIEEPGAPPDRRATLPSNMRDVLWVASRLKAETSPETIRQLRNHLEITRKFMERWLSIDEPIPESVEEWLEISAKKGEHLDVYRRVDQQLSVMEESARMFEGTIKGAGYRWNWDTGVIEILPGSHGGRPRQLLTDLVMALIRHHRIDENTTETRERIAADLAQVFSASVLDTSKRSPLYNAVNNSLKAKK